MTLRIDATALRKPERTEEGYIRAEGIIATPGVLEYRTKSGETVRELVPAETLKDPEYLRSLEDKPLTLEHPKDRLTPENVMQFEVGNSDDVEWVEGVELPNGEIGDGVKGAVVIRDAKAIKAFDAGILELSPAYEVELEDQSGTSEFGEYDRVQKTRRAGNHIALTRAGRAGSRAALRADFEPTGEFLDAFSEALNIDRELLHRAKLAGEREDDNNTLISFSEDGMPKIRLDGVEYEVSDAGVAQALNQFRKDQEAEQQELSGELQTARENIKQFRSKIEELEKERDAKQTEIDKLTGQLEALKAEMPGGQPAGDGEDEPGEGSGGDGDDPKQGPSMDGRHDSRLEWYQERRELEASADALRMDSSDIDELENMQLMRAIVEKWVGEERADASDAQILGAYSVIKEQIAEKQGERDDSYTSASRRNDARPSGSGDNLRDAQKKYQDRIFGRG